MTGKTPVLGGAFSLPPQSSPLKGRKKRKKISAYLDTPPQEI